MKNWNFRVYGTGFGFCGLIAASLFGIYQLWKQKTCHNRLQGIQSETIKEVDIFELLNNSKRVTGTIFNVLKDNPLLARNYDHKGRLPLHVELSKSIPDYELVKLLLNLYPESAKIKDRFWQALPLHFCVHKDRADYVDLDLIKVVLEAYPEATSTTDGANFLPIHRAVNRVLPHPDIIDLLLHADPDSLKIPTSNGNTCLHWLVSQPFPRTAIDIEILGKIFAANPSALFTRNLEKKNPLEILISKAAIEEAEFVQKSENEFGAKYVLGCLIELSQTITNPI